MKQRRPAFVFLLSTLLLGAVGCPEPQKEGIDWRGESYAALQAEAELNGQPLLVLICPGQSSNPAALPASGDPCGPLQSEASTPEHKALADGTLVKFLGADSPEGAQLVRVHEVGQLPSLLLFSSKNDLLVRRDGASTFDALQPFPNNRAPWNEVADFRMAELEDVRERQREASFRAPDPDTALSLVEQAFTSGSSDRAAELLARIEAGELNLQQLVTAGDLSEKIDRPDLAADFWHRMLTKYPDVGARAQALGRYARTLVLSGQSPRLERYVFGATSLRTQWEYLSVATAVSGAGDDHLAKRIAQDGLDRFPEGSHRESLEFYLE